LKDKIISSFTGSKEELEEILELVNSDYAVFPFNDYEYMITNMLNRGCLTFERYLDIRSEYISNNPNLWIFEISAPRKFGENFAQTYIMGKSSNIKKASKKLDPDYSGQYDLWFDGIRIEVKASRVVSSDSDEPLYMKALSRNTKQPFLMNFQQLKPQYCDVFIWLAVFRDEILIWVINSQTILNHPLYSVGQHRGNRGNEGQMHITHENINQLDEFILGNRNIEEVLSEEANRI
jgi:hypothetical protein